MYYKTLFTNFYLHTYVCVWSAYIFAYTYVNYSHTGMHPNFGSIDFAVYLFNTNGKYCLLQWGDYVVLSYLNTITNWHLIHK